MSTPGPLPAGTPRVLSVRAQQVMLDAHVAAQFGTTTSALNQAVARNPHKFSEEHCFRLTRAEQENLISQTVTSSARHGGARKPPMVYTLLGVARLATVLTSDEALRATDLILKTFLDVQAQIAAGRTRIAVRNAGQLVPPADPVAADGFARRLQAAMTALLDAVIDVQRGTTVRQTAETMTSEALGHLRERLQTRGLTNDKLAAETLLILKQAELVEAQVRKSDADTKGVDLKNLQTQIDLVKQIAALHREAQPPALIRMLDELSPPASAAVLRLPHAGTNHEDLA